MLTEGGGPINEVWLNPPRDQASEGTAKKKVA
ncbi:hypothetical protein Thimo_1669 [Thioflavicoccus mobilis 8321]|uniref:Uncharacterized protein n=1 Tax=Thioflavicoccus mobilis 8321 TaxID=765912 RepID=L0GWU7_9GAMM|nr:hypothetical protein Thimo_1669 [Thioflavicoccus mobilis 8321]